MELPHHPENSSGSSSSVSITCINYREVDYEQRIQELTNGEGVDAVFEMLRVASIRPESLRCCGASGG